MPEDPGKWWRDKYRQVPVLLLCARYQLPMEQVIEHLFDAYVDALSRLEELHRKMPPIVLVADNEEK